MVETASIEKKVESAKEMFSSLETWEQKYKKIISLGRTLEAYPEEYRKESLKVKGCQSQVWLYACETEQGRVHYLADSDAMIVKGLVALLLSVYSDEPPYSILKTPPDFIKDIGLDKNLTPSRTNGLFSMVKQIMLYAQAFAMKQSAQKIAE